MHTRALSQQLLWALATTVAMLGCGGEPVDESAPTSGTGVTEAALRRPRAPTLTPQQSGTLNRLQAVSPVDDKVVWASGVGGTFVLTTDGGKTWKAGVVPGAETLQFRDVEGVSAKEAYLLSAGPGESSRIYKTVDGGKTWTLQFLNQDPNAFYDCFAFWTPKRGLTMSDAVAGRFPVIRTTDGRTWQDIGDNLPPALAGEAAFAASGTCVAVHGEKHAWIATGAAAQARILATTDGGRSWEAYATPTVQGTPASGVFTVAFRDARHGILGAGDLEAPDAFADTMARSRDGGKTWKLVTRPTFPGAVFGLAYALEQEKDHHGHHRHHRSHDSRDLPFVVITGPAGAAWSADEGDTWTPLPGVANYWAVAFADERTGWLVGIEGRILKIRF